MMTEFTKTKMHFALGMIGTLFALHPLVERYPDLGFDYQVLQWSVSLKMIYAYALLGGLLALCVYCYGVALMGQHSSWVERLGNFSYAVAILTPPLYGMLYLSTFLSKTLEAEHLQWVAPTVLIVAWLVFSQMLAWRLRRHDRKVTAEELAQQEIESLRKARDLFAHEHYDLCVIEAWKALEARLRRVLLRRGITPPSDKPQAMIDAAARAGLVKGPALGLLQDFRKQWNVAVSVEPLSREAADVAMTAARNILATIAVDDPMSPSRHKV